MRAALLVLLPVLAIGCGGESAREGGGPYDAARDLCSLDSAEKLADEFGGDPDDPRSVAGAYADSEFSGSARERARAGCLAGLGSRG
ncbi:MAG: hypothetical protein JW895_05110 [Thermoleophilaceae bacterium]|nr:hypothetical protein [Thermoleophilaceae bacterium]